VAAASLAPLVAAMAVAPAMASAAGAAMSPAARNTAHPAAKITTVASGLKAPKHLKFGPGGLYVAESGVGGKPGHHNCVMGPGTESGKPTRFCVGLTGALTRITPSGTHVVRRLPSVSEQGGGASGPADVSFAHHRVAVIFQDVLATKSGRNLLPGPHAHIFGSLVIQGKHRMVVDLARFAAEHPQSGRSLGTVPGEKAYDSDPYAVTGYGRGYAVADAAANSLVYVGPHGGMHIMARFPAKRETAPAGVFGPKPVTVRAQAVPTSVAVGPDGALYVGILRGVPSRPGTAYIYRVVPGHAPKIWARGLTAVTAIAFDHRGRLLATEFSTGGLLAPPTVPGALVRISQNGRTVQKLPVPGLFAVTGVAVGPRGAVYVSNIGVGPGKILKITGLG
jgi:hypothetical protein